MRGVHCGIDNENFTFTGRLVKEGGKSFVADLSDQDYVHNAKKTCQSFNASLKSVVTWG